MKPPKITGRLIGYARVSTAGQSTATQVEQLREAGCEVILRENASGGDRDRPELAKALAAARPGGVLVVAKLDCLARSMLHLLETVEDLDRRGIGFRSLGDPVDTTTPQGRFTLQILAAVGELERALIRERTVAGLEHARSEGRVGGNPGLAAARIRQRSAGWPGRVTTSAAGASPSTATSCSGSSSSSAPN
jgi:DNA invertase Pin-like site-specific DNA recombinase